MTQGQFQQRPRPDFPPKPEAATFTPVMEAAKQNDFEKIRDYAAAGHDMNAADSLGWSALYHAVMNEQEEAAVTLLNAHANPVQPNKMGDTPLMEACRRQMDAVVTRIVKSGCSFDAQEKVNGHTAVMVAIETGDGYAACILAENGADTSSLLNKKGQTAEQMARIYFSGKVLGCFENIVARKKAAATALRQQELKENVASATKLDHGITPLKTLRFGPKKSAPGAGNPPANG